LINVLTEITHHLLQLEARPSFGGISVEGVTLNWTGL
jgi:hypothetical protein